MIHVAVFFFIVSVVGLLRKIKSEFSPQKLNLWDMKIIVKWFYCALLHLPVGIKTILCITEATQNKLRCLQVSCLYTSYLLQYVSAEDEQNHVNCSSTLSEILKCDHSNESYWAVLSCGAVYYAVQGGSNFWVCGWNPKVWPFKWKLLSITFLWCCLLCCTRWFYSTFCFCGWNP